MAQPLRLDHERHHLVAIRATGTRSPLWLMPGAGGNVLCFHTLSSRIRPDRPVLALQARGIDGDKRPHASIEAMAAAYLHEMRQTGWTGPWFLAGYSGGGTTAFEIARRLLALGEEVPMVVVLDGFSPHVRWNGALRRGWAHLKKFRTHGPSFAHYFLQHVMTRRRKLARRERLVAARRVLPPKMRAFDLAESFATAFRQYRCVRLDTQIVLYRATHQADVLFKPTREQGWGECSSRPIDVVHLEGDHTSICSSPGLAELDQRMATIETGLGRPSFGVR